LEFVKLLTCTMLRQLAYLSTQNKSFRRDVCLSHQGFAGLGANKETFVGTWFAKALKTCLFWSLQGCFLKGFYLCTALLA